MNDIALVWKTLDDITHEGGHPYANHITDIIHGCAKGADTFADYYCQARYTVEGNYIRVWRYPADWKTYGKAAGPKRNVQMLLEGRPDLVIAFWDGESKGTQNMIDQATKAGVEVKVINI